MMQTAMPLTQGFMNLNAGSSLGFASNSLTNNGGTKNLKEKIMRLKHNKSGQLRKGNQTAGCPSTLVGPTAMQTMNEQ